MTKTVSPSPKKSTMKVTVSEDPQPYQITLTFNEKAQLTNISKPDNMPLPMTIEHLAVGVQFLAKKAGK